MYDIMMNSQIVGQAEVIKEGLYYRFSCKCTPPNEGIHKIIVSDGKNTKDLGICVPTGEWFCLVSRVPVKNLPGEKLDFMLKLKDQKQTAVPVATDEPFPNLDELDNAYFQESEQGAAILIDPAPGQQDSDRSQESLHIWESP